VIELFNIIRRQLH